MDDRAKLKYNIAYYYPSFFSLSDSLGLSVSPVKVFPPEDKNNTYLSCNNYTEFCKSYLFVSSKYSSSYSAYPAHSSSSYSAYPGYSSSSYSPYSSDSEYPSYCAYPYSSFDSFSYSFDSSFSSFNSSFDSSFSSYSPASSCSTSSFSSYSFSSSSAGTWHNFSSSGGVSFSSSVSGKNNSSYMSGTQSNTNNNINNNKKKKNTKNINNSNSNTSSSSQSTFSSHREKSKEVQYDNENTIIRDPYELLGVDRYASEEEIRSAFRKKARQYHPDKLINNNNNNAKISSHKFIQLQEAYETVLKSCKNFNCRKFTFDEYNNAAILSKENLENLGDDTYCFICRCGDAIPIYVDDSLTGHEVYECNSCSLKFKLNIESFK